jgi:hypothetical protein
VCGSRSRSPSFWLGSVVEDWGLGSDNRNSGSTRRDAVTILWTRVYV